VNISISCLSKNFKEVMALVEEMILKPRFDEKALARVKNEIKSMIRQNSVDPGAIASSVTDRLLFGAESRLAQLPLSPSKANFNIAGAIDHSTCEKAISSLVKKWTQKSNVVAILEPAAGIPAKRSQIYFVDYPNAP
jgi:zinc protease